MATILERLKKAAKAKEDKISKTNVDKGGDEKYTLSNLKNSEYLLSKLPKGSLLGGAVDEDGQIDVDLMEKALQRAVYTAMKAAAEEQALSLEHIKQELRDEIKNTAKETTTSLDEKGLKFFPDDVLKERLAQAEYKELKAKYPDASVQDLKDATLEILGDIVSTPSHKADEEEEEGKVSDFSDLLEGLEDEGEEAPAKKDTEETDPTGET